MFEDSLIQSGLSPDQAAVYAVLLEHGYLPARRIVQYTTMKRGMVYKTLDQLIERGLVEKRDEQGAVSVFFPASPTTLKELLEKEEQRVSERKAVLESVMGRLSSAYNLLSGKPNIQFYEGRKGMEEVIDDSLYATSEICTYVDIETVMKHMAEFNDRYTAKREKLGIKKKGFVLDTPFARNVLKNYHEAVTEVKFIHYDAPPFKTVMQIYDNKVSYVTLEENNMIGVIIEDKPIFEMHKFLFEYLWSITPFPDEKQKSNTQSSISL